MEENIIKNLILKKKYRSIKLDETANEEFLENTFKPIINPLKEIIQERKIKKENENTTFKDSGHDLTTSSSTPFKNEKIMKTILPGLHLIPK